MSEGSFQGDARRKLSWGAGLAGAALAAFALWLYVRDPSSHAATRQSDEDWVREVEQRNSTGHEMAEAVVATGNGFSVAGHTNSRQPGVDQAWVLRFDDPPSVRWDRTYGGKLGTFGRAIALLPGGRLVVAGEAQVARNRFQGWILALSAEGTVLWERTAGQEGLTSLDAVTVLKDGTIAAGGTQSGAGWVMRLDAEGQTLWETQLPKIEEVTAVVELPAGGIAVLGTAEFSTVGLGTSRLLFLGSAGQVTGEKDLLVQGRRGELIALAPLPGKGLVATGNSGLPGSTDWNLWVVCMDVRGNTLWEYIPADIKGEVGRAVTAAADGGITVAGFSGEGGKREAKVWRFSADGRLLWQRVHGGTGDDLGNGIAHLADGSLVVVGSTTSFGAGKTDLWTYRLSSQGELIWEQTFGAP